MDARCRWAFCLVLLAVVGIAHAFDGEPVVIDTPNGPVKGLKGQNFYSFRGIPYGKAGRWEDPSMVTSWSGTWDGTNWGKCCPSTERPSSAVSEDCLFANVWTPKLPSETSTKLPVVFWIHGGAFFLGCSASNVFQGDFIANTTDTVVVSINYRLGALGFLSAPQWGINGNFGIKDQILGLDWVQRMIPAFGGDINNVTIFGQSAGGISVATLLQSPVIKQKKTFHAAIIQSNPFGVLFRTPEQQANKTANFISLLGCTFGGKQCAQSAPVQAILNVQLLGVTPQWPLDWQYVIAQLPWVPTIDGALVPGNPVATFGRGDIYQVPVMLGCVKNETLSFAWNLQVGLGVNFTSAEYYGLLGVLFGWNGIKVSERYPLRPTEVLQTLSEVFTHAIFTCPTRFAARGISNVVPTYRYEFLHTPPADPLNSAPLCRSGGASCHSAENTFVFHSQSLASRVPWTPEEEQLSWDITYSWVSLGPLGTPGWPHYNPTSSNYIKMFDTPAPTVSSAGYIDDLCDFWDKITNGYVASGLFMH